MSLSPALLAHNDRVRSARAPSRPRRRMIGVAVLVQRARFCVLDSDRQRQRVGFIVEDG